MHTRTDLQYSYEPRDFFETSTVLSISAGKVTIDEGTVTVTLPQPMNPVERAFAQSVTEVVRGVFQARQLVDHRQFTLSGPNIRHHRPDGLQDVVLLVESAKSVWHVSSPDIRVTDAAGNIVVDTRAERIRGQTELVQRLAAKINLSPLLQRLLRSYSKAVSDPPNELVHLYEIRDAVSTHFGDEASARQALGLTATDWSKLGRLANAEPIQEGRHRGRQPGPLREATEDELESARKIARQIIESFAVTL